MNFIRSPWRNLIWRNLIWALLISSLVSAEDKERDIKFQDLGLHKVIESLAKSQGKSVMFSRSVGDTPVNVALERVTTTFALKLILENYGYIAVQKGSVLHIMTQAERGIASTSPTSIITLTNVIARDIAPTVQQFLGAGTGASVAINESLNALLVSAPDETLVKIKRLVTELDQEASQVFIEAKLIETSTSFSRNLGIEWGTSGAGNRDQGISVSAPSSSRALSAVVSNGSLEARIAAGERTGEVKVISSPKVTTLNGQAANIESLTTFSIRSLTATGSGGAATSNGGIQSIRAGVRLVVTPYIVSMDQVRLNIQLSKSDPDFAQAVDGIPGISDNTANTSLIVRNGQTASIGGLIRKENTFNQEGVPILSRIPILGLLFGSAAKRKEDKELLIFITPTVFKGERGAWGMMPEDAGGDENNPYVGMKPLRNPAEAAAEPETAEPVAAPATPAAPATAAAVGAPLPPATPVAPAPAVAPQLITNP